MASSTRSNSGFLVLAPVTSDSYPTDTQKSRTSSTSSTDSAVDLADAADPTQQIRKDRRSSSTSSTNSATVSRRFFLKLNPVHDGGNPNESDFVEAT